MPVLTKKRKLFGTDGVRGVANDFLTADLAFKLGKAGVQVLTERQSTQKVKVVIGKDTRISSDMLEGALIAGICSMGSDVLKAGVVPTPAVAHLVKKLDAQIGIMISASHNPIEDNGIKFFSGDGFKLPDSVEEKIEYYVENFQQESVSWARPTGKDLGRVIEMTDANKLYLEYLKKAVGEVSLHGLKIVLDCAHGAAYRIAPSFFSDLGANLLCLHNQPNGININVNCGATHVDSLWKVVVAVGADVGLAFDGDADRLIAVDEKGNVVNGDHTMMILTLSFLEQGLLKEKTLVTTMMSNIGLEKAVKEAGGKIIRTKIGDRYVLEEMLSSGAILGGEQSGHIIVLDRSTTGDGILTAGLLVKHLVESGKSLSVLASKMEQYPQILRNVRVKDRELFEKDSEVNHLINEIKNRLQDRGRLFVRPSGTEPLVRIMAEGPDILELELITDQLAELIERKYG